MTRHIAGLREVADRYDVLLSDVWGVIHNGRDVFEAPCAALAKWRRERGPVILISNSPRPSPDLGRQLDGLGVPRAAWSALVSSGDATRELLAARAPGPAWRIGPARDDPLFEGLGLAFTGPGEAAFIACSGPEHDEIETPEDYRAVLAAAAARGIEMVCANPDKVVQRGDKLIYCAGALADLYKTLGGPVAMAGKPFAPIYDLALSRAEASLGRALDRRRVLAIGDAIATDIAGAQMQDLDTLFIASGIHGDAAVDRGGALNLAALDTLRTANQAAPDFAMADLAW